MLLAPPKHPAVRNMHTQSSTLRAYSESIVPLEGRQAKKALLREKLVGSLRYFNFRSKDHALRYGFRQMLFDF